MKRDLKKSIKTEDYLKMKAEIQTKEAAAFIFMSYVFPPKIWQLFFTQKYCNYFYTPLKKIALIVIIKSK